MHASEQYPLSFQFLGGYLHQDFDLDYGSAEAAIEQALADWHDDERLSGVEAELEALLRLSDVGLQRTVNRICDYHPPGDGLTYRDWVVQVLGRVHAARR
jgi:hypothetical protein